MCVLRICNHAWHGRGSYRIQLSVCLSRHGCMHVRQSHTHLHAYVCVTHAVGGGGALTAHYNTGQEVM